jgi:flagellar protein FlaI
MNSPSAKICTIEETPELTIPQEHHLQLKTRESFSITESKFDVPLFSLAKFALRAKPDYIIPGEIRGEEVHPIFQIVATGHGGITSFHADSPQAALVRLGTEPMKVEMGNRQRIWSFLLTNSKKDDRGSVKRRAVVSTEVKPVAGDVELVNIFEWRPDTDTYVPDSATAVVEKSYRLKDLMTITGCTETRVIKELESRTKFIEQLILRDKSTFEEVSKEMMGFYRNGRSGAEEKEEVELVSAHGAETRTAKEKVPIRAPDKPPIDIEKFGMSGAPEVKGERSDR